MEPTGRNRLSEKWQSRMALWKFGEAGLGGRGADRPKPPVGKMAKSDGIAEVSWGGSGGSGSRPAETASRKNGKVRWHCGSFVRRVWGSGSRLAGQNRQSEKWLSPMALRECNGPKFWPQVVYEKTADNSYTNCTRCRCSRTPWYVK